MNEVIVSRHQSAVQFIASQLASSPPATVRYENCVPVAVTLYQWRDERCGIDYGDTQRDIPVVGSAKPEDVKGKVVYGNLPLHLAVLAAKVVAVEFAGQPPRGTEYTLEDMQRARAQLVEYVVRPAGEYNNQEHLTREQLNAGGYAC